MNIPTKKEPNTDLFREKLAQMINLDHPLCVMSKQIGWDKVDAFILS